MSHGINSFALVLDGVSNRTIKLLTNVLIFTPCITRFIASVERLLSVTILPHNSETPLYLLHCYATIS